MACQIDSGPYPSPACTVLAKEWEWANLNASQNHQINDYLKFSLEHVTFDQNGRPRLINPIYMGKYNKNRTSAHTMSRIFFHHHDASNQLQLPTIEHLVQVAATPIMVEEQEEVNEEEDEEDYEEDQTMTDQ